MLQETQTPCEEQGINITVSSGSQNNVEKTSNIGGISGDRLLAFIKRVERLEEEKKVIAEDIKEVYGEAKAVGFDVKIVRKIVKLRKMDKEAMSEEQELTGLYANAIGMQGILF